MDNLTATEQDPTLQALAQMEAAEDKALAAANSATTTNATTAGSATNTARAGESGAAKGPNSPDPEPDGEALATEETQLDQSQGKDKEPPKPADGQSKFAKNQQRLEGGWKTLNERKGEADKRETALKAREDEFARKEQEFKQRESQLAKPKYTPQQYSDAAKQFEAQAEDLEAKGEYDQADRQRALAATAREQAKQLRANPPPAPEKTSAEQSEEFKALQKEWYAKAAIDFPAVTKTGTAENGKLLDLIRAEPNVLNDPKGMYYATRLVAAETLAARAAPLEKENGELRAKVKELEGKLTITPGSAAENLDAGSNRPVSQQTEEELEASLRRDLRGTSSWS